jgi:uncharacterized protein (UPF0332 family)
MKLKNMIIDEYEQAFPFEQEYNMWINSMERDYREECEYRAKLVVTNKTVLHLDNTEDYSPYVTVNS